jgi:hypothetical protein
MPAAVLCAVQYRDPADDSAYNTGAQFPPPGKGLCSCFPCPAGFQSKGGALNSSAAACLPKLQSCCLQVRYQLRVSSGNPCDAAVTAAVGSKLMAAMKKQAKAADKSMVLFSECAAVKVCTFLGCC